MLTVFFDYISRFTPMWNARGCADFLEQGCILVAIDPIPSQVHDIRVYPNPFGTFVTFDIEGCECPQLELRVLISGPRSKVRKTYPQTLSFIARVYPRAFICMSCVTPPTACLSAVESSSRNNHNPKNVWLLTLCEEPFLRQVRKSTYIISPKNF